MPTSEIARANNQRESGSGLGALERVDRFRRVFFPKDARGLIGAQIERGENIDFQFKKIERLAHQAAFDKFIGHDSTHAFDIEGAAGGKEFQTPRVVCAGQHVLTAPGDELGVARDRSAADGTFAVDVFDKIERLGVLWAFLFYDADDCGNYFAGLLDDHGVADADVLAFDFFFVVQCGARDGTAARKTGSSSATGVSVPVRPT